jgi:hypothetical protein
MIDQYIKSIWIIVPITLVTIVLEGIRMLWTPKKAKSSTSGSLFGMLIFGLGFGFLAIMVFNWLNGTWPATAVQMYFWLAVGSAIALTILAAIMPPIFKMRWKDVAVWTALNFIWGLGYGWFLPQVLGAAAGPL